MRKLKVFIADDHAMFRQAVAKLLGAFERIGEVKEAANGKELVNLVRGEIPDVAILDLEMPVWNGVKTCQKLASEFPEVKILVVSMHDSETQVYDLLQSGAHAFLSKNSEAEELESAIYSIVDKGIYRNKSMSKALRMESTLRRPMKFEIHTELSDQERKIVEFLCQGMTNKQISYHLSLSEYTVRNHKVRIMRKTGTINTPSLVKFAIEHRLIQAESYD